MSKFESFTIILRRLGVSRVQLGQFLGVSVHTVNSWFRRRIIPEPCYRLVVGCLEIPGFKEWLRKRF
jgi:DNA-binding transcriptional regulator YiaG